jgi:hypothetical protein
MRFKPRRRRRSFLDQFSHQVRKRALTVDDLDRRRNLANAVSSHWSSAIEPCWAAICPIDGGRVCRPRSATATSTVRVPARTQQLDRRARCRCGGACKHEAVVPPMTPSSCRNQNHIRIMTLQLPRRRGDGCLCHFETARWLLRSDRHGCA